MKRIKTCRIPAPSGQSGAAAVEFALVFPILLAVTYASLVYSYVYFLQQSISFAAQQGVQAAVAVVPTSSATTDSSNRLIQANLVEASTLSWLPASQIALVTTLVPPAGCPGAPAGQTEPTFSYQINFALSGGAGGALFPSLVNLPFFGGVSVPPLPTTLTACAVAFT